MKEEQRNNKLIINDLPVVIFYANRLDGYELEGQIKWVKEHS